ncbi:MAG: IS4 family transposase [Sulfurovaceae bacterium]|nr:IS4 family transposase [Sulfurovaceae bacterium]
MYKYLRRLWNKYNKTRIKQKTASKKSVEYLKKITESILKERYKPVDKEIKGLLSSFGNTYIEDNSSISLQEDLKDEYKGSGGTASSSALKIYLNYNVTQNSIESLEIASWNKSDAKFTGNIIPILKKDDLVLRDLGFFKIDKLKAIAEKRAYYISRYFLATNLYVDNAKVDLLEFLKSKKEYKIIDENIKISTQKLPTRLIAIRVSDEIFNQRVRALNKKYKQLRKTPQKSTIELQRYVIFITNIPKETIAPEHIGTIYRLRWSIELVFKRWKSIFKIDRVTGTKGNRTLCFIYAKIIAILLISNFENYALSLAKQLNRELSYEKFFKWILSRDRFQRLFASEFTINSFLKKLEQTIPRMLRDKRKKRLSSLDLILSSASFYDCDWA